MAAKLPDAFLSYTRFDDRRGDISAFRDHLSDAVRELTGERFEIFQDVDDIEVGERWSEKLDQMLAEAGFFIPVLTPSYFKSDACRDELEKFLRAEERAGRQDLILPIHFIRCAVLDDKELRKDDNLAIAIHQRQRWEWRDLRHYSFRNRKVRLKIESLALEIAKARQTRGPRRADAPTNSMAKQPSVASDRTPSTIRQGSTLREEIRDRPVISSWTALLDYLQVTLAHEPIEQFRVMFLDRKNVLIKDEVQQRGTVDHTPLYPREIAKRALELAASAIIMVHNHPSGDPTPSRADLDMTKQVVTALSAVGITVHDHVIVGKNKHTSFKSQRLI